MQILTTTNTFSLECGDDISFNKEQVFFGRLFFNCDSLIKLISDSDEMVFEKLSNIKYKITGKVIFKGEYLLIIENKIRIALVLNNEFRFGNHIMIGNKDINIAEIALGDVIEATGYFQFQQIFLCIFTFLPDEKFIPNVDYPWRVKGFYAYDSDEEGYEYKKLSDYKSVDRIDTSSQTVDDTYFVEFDLMSETPKAFDSLSGFHGYVNTICWIDEVTWIKNCEGRIIDGVKKGKWTYYDRFGNLDGIFIYEED